MAGSSMLGLRLPWGPPLVILELISFQEEESLFNLNALHLQVSSCGPGAAAGAGGCPCGVYKRQQRVNPLKHTMGSANLSTFHGTVLHSLIMIVSTCINSLVFIHHGHCVLPALHGTTSVQYLLRLLVQLSAYLFICLAASSSIKFLGTISYFLKYTLSCIAL